MRKGTAATFSGGAVARQPQQHGSLASPRVLRNHARALRAAMRRR
jgi:hypothetical protein